MQGEPELQARNAGLMLGFIEAVGFSEEARMGAMLARSRQKTFEGCRWRCGGCGLTAGPNLRACGIIMVMVMDGEYVA
jgi:hypothetical protein